MLPVVPYLTPERWAKGTTINNLGEGPEEIEKKEISEALLQEKKAFPRKKLIHFRSFLRAPSPDH